MSDTDRFGTRRGMCKECIGTDEPCPQFQRGDSGTCSYCGCAPVKHSRAPSGESCSSEMIDSMEHRRVPLNNSLHTSAIPASSSVQSTTTGSHKRCVSLSVPPMESFSSDATNEQIDDSFAPDHRLTSSAIVHNSRLHNASTSKETSNDYSSLFPSNFRGKRVCREEEIVSKLSRVSAKRAYNAIMKDAESVEEGEWDTPEQEDIENSSINVALSYQEKIIKQHSKEILRLSQEIKRLRQIAEGRSRRDAIEFGYDEIDNNLLEKEIKYGSVNLMKLSTSRKPSTFGVSIARVLWSDTELMEGQLMKKRNAGRPPLSPTRSQIFRECVIQRCGINGFDSAARAVNQVGIDIKKSRRIIMARTDRSNIS